VPDEVRRPRPPLYLLLQSYPLGVFAVWCPYLPQKGRDGRVSRYPASFDLPPAASSKVLITSPPCRVLFPVGASVASFRFQLEGPSLPRLTVFRCTSEEGRTGAGHLFA